MKTTLFVDLFLKHDKRLRHYCLYLTNNNFADAEDLVQESFTRFFEKFFAKQSIQDEGVSSILEKEVSYSYLKSIARNTRYEWYRKNQGFKNTEPIDESYEALEQTDITNLDKQIDVNQLQRDCYIKLNQFERSIFIAFYFEGYSQEEIAKMFSISVRMVKHRLAQAKLKLRGKK